MTNEPTTVESWLGNCFACFTEGEPDGCPICGRVNDDDAE